ncbi:hypothetical protein HanIR_Chr16g0834911 [Helianthus annuus]|nr:hypothetical protein HanIR_Chr16g0834911 [Helianthus annuus]
MLCYPFQVSQPNSTVVTKDSQFRIRINHVFIMHITQVAFELNIHHYASHNRKSCSNNP